MHSIDSDKPHRDAFPRYPDDCEERLNDAVASSASIGADDNMPSDGGNAGALAFTGERYVPSELGQIKLEHLHRYAACRDLVEGRVVLDIACGEGYGSALLANWAAHVFGVDIDAVAVAHARARYGGWNRNLSFQTGDCVSIPLPDAAVDVVVSFETIEHHDRHEEMIAEIKRVLRPNGLLVISSPNKLAYSDIPGYQNPFHVKELYFEELKALLACFANVLFCGQKVALGSFLVPLDGSPSTLAALVCNEERVVTGAALTGEPIYYFCICSDAPLPRNAAGASVLTDRKEDAYQRLLDGYRGQESVATQRALELEALRAQAGAETQLLQHVLSTERKRLAGAQVRMAALERELNSERADAAEVRLANERLAHYNGQLSERLDAMRNSTSWSVTAPMRGAMRKARTARARVGRLARAVYHRLPLRIEARQALKSVAYRAFGIVLRGSKSYEHWRQHADHGSPANVGSDDRPVARPVARAPYSVPPGPRALVVDDRTPAIDRDAGSLRVIHIIKVIQALGYEVTFLPFDLKRVDRDADYLESLGARCISAAHVPSAEAHLQAEGSSYSLIYSSRPDPTAALLPLYRQHAPSAKVVYDTIDLHFLRERRLGELSGDSSVLAAASARKQQELALTRSVDCTLVVSEVEREVLERECSGARLLVIPLMHDLFPEPARFFERRNIVFLGGYQHPPNVDAVLFFVREIFPLVRARLPEVRFYIAGSNPPMQLFDLSSDAIVVTGHLPDLAPVMNTCRVAVHPLRYGAGAKGKILTAMSFGLPGVGTPVAAEGMGLRDGEDFLVAAEPASFAHALVRLYSDEQLWNRLSFNGRAVVAERHSLTSGVDRFIRLHEMLGLRLPDIALSDRNIGGAAPVAIDEAPAIESRTLHSRTEYLRFEIEEASARQARDEMARRLVASRGNVFSYSGRCFACSQTRDFQVDQEYGFVGAEGTRIPNWRERLVCPNCQLNCRMRASLHFWLTQFRPSLTQRIYVTEQKTPLFAWLKSRFKNVTGSEYLGNVVPFGSMSSDAIRNETLTHLTFPDQSFEHLLSFDVLEHIPNYKEALTEVHRCLAPGGTFYFSVPFDLSSQQHIVRARITAGRQVEHILPPEYHGDPLNTKGCLCFYHFGWQLLEELFECGFSRPAAHLVWSDHYGYLGGEQLFFSARKPT